MSDFHWSFNYFHDAERSDLIPIHHFQRSAFLTILTNYFRDARPISLGDSDAWSVTYATLFNFNAAYQRPPDGGLPDLKAGELIVAKSPAGSVIHYGVQFSDTTSGENGSAQFDSLPDSTREIVNDWRVAIKNDADGSYNDFNLQGRIVGAAGGNRLIELSLCGADFTRVGTVPASLSCAPFWALFDAAFYNDGGRRLSGRRKTALLEGLEHLRPDTVLGHLEEFDLCIDGYSGHLRGYFVHGTGLPTTFCWLDDNGHVVIVSTLYTTWVLQRVELGRPIRG